MVLKGKTVKIDVTQDDIDHGKRRDCHECPISRAFMRTFPNMSKVSTSGQGVHCFPKKKSMSKGFNLVPNGRLDYRQAADFVYNFDDKGTLFVQPTTIEYIRI